MMCGEVAADHGRRRDDEGRREHGAEDAAAERDVVVATASLERLGREAWRMLGVADGARAVVVLERAVANVRALDANETRPRRKRAHARERQEKRERHESKELARPCASRRSLHPCPGMAGRRLQRSRAGA